MQNLFRGSVRDIDRLISLLSGFYGFDVVALIRDEESRWSWSPIRSYHDLDKGLRSAWESYLSVKSLLIPPISEYLRISPGFELIPPRYEGRTTALFGLRSCDAVAIRVLDGVLMGRDPQYTALRKSVGVIIVEECVEPGQYCFCGDTRSGPYARENFDIAYAVLDRDVVVFRSGSNLGDEIISRLGLEESTPEISRRYIDAMREAERRASIGIDVGGLEDSLRKVMKCEDLWRRLSELCVGCSNCNMVCPTCFCTEFATEVDLDGWTRIVRKWFGCLSYAYGAVAGGHFRPRLFMRYRHFVLHKFLFYPKQVGRIGCVGCGRCIAWCPAGLDIRKALEEVMRFGKA